MNRLIQNPFHATFPQAIEESLDEQYSVCCLFHPVGQYLASGCINGNVVIWDMDTKNVLRLLCSSSANTGGVEASSTSNATADATRAFHTGYVTCLRWFQKSSLILSASIDGSVILWDTFSDRTIFQVQFEKPVLVAEFYPNHWNKLIVCTQENFPFLVEIPVLEGAALYEEDTGRERRIVCIEKGLFPETAESTIAHEKPIGKHGFALAVSEKSNSSLFAYFGDSKGILYSYDLNSEQVVANQKVVNQSSGIKQIRCKANFSNHLLISSNDRCVRLFLEQEEDGTLLLLHKFQDLVNRFHWSQVTFSGDNEYIVAGTMSKERHNIYIWDRGSGNLLKILEGPRENLMDLSWHPNRPLVASVSSYGNIYLWTSNQEENWSAYAPDFKELDENLEYDEKEDEFDVVLDIAHGELLKMDKVSLPSSADDSIYIDLSARSLIYNLHNEGDLIMLPLREILPLK